MIKLLFKLSIGLRHTAQGLVSGTIGEAWGQGCRTGRGAEGQGQEAGSKGEKRDIQSS